jgi:hypothetical protein
MKYKNRNDIMPPSITQIIVFKETLFLLKSALELTSLIPYLSGK